MEKRNLSIIVATKKEIEDIVCVEQASFPQPWSYNMFEEDILYNERAKYFVAKIGESIVGYAGYWQIFDEGHITNIAVHPNFRRQGIASSLLNHMIDDFKDNDIVAATLEVRKSNEAAISLYLKNGFVEKGVRKHYYENTEDAIIMWKEGIL